MHTDLTPLIQPNPPPLILPQSLCCKRNINTTRISSAGVKLQEDQSAVVKTLLNKPCPFLLLLISERWTYSVFLSAWNLCSQVAPVELQLLETFCGVIGLTDTRVMALLTGTQRLGSSLSSSTGNCNSQKSVVLVKLTDKAFQAISNYVQRHQVLDYVARLLIFKGHKYNMCFIFTTLDI